MAACGRPGTGIGCVLTLRHRRPRSQALNELQRTPPKSLDGCEPCGHPSRQTAKRRVLLLQLPARFQCGYSRDDFCVRASLGSHARTTDSETAGSDTNGHERVLPERGSRTRLPAGWLLRRIARPKTSEPTSRFLAPGRDFGAEAFIAGDLLLIFQEKGRGAWS